MNKSLNAQNLWSKVKSIITITAIMYVFLVSLSLMSGGFKLIGKDIAADILQATSNPFVGLLIGILATALVQSSSTITTMIVAIVASGTLPLYSAVPMIMGANIGTSVTSTIVALAHMSDRNEFKHAIGAATVHDFFNLLVVLILLPLEYFTGILSYAGTVLADWIYIPSEGAKGFSILGATVKPVAKWMISLFDKNVIVILIISVAMLILSLRGLTKNLKRTLVGKSQERMEKYLFGSPLKSLFWGTAITAGVQSSSVTTSLTVPLVASEKISLRKAFPFLMGANIGTTVTAMIAALSQNEVALAIALCHVMFNIFGVLILFPIAAVRNIPIFLAETLGRLTLKNRMVSVAYILIVFFIFPFTLIYTTSDNNQEEIESNATKIEVVNETNVSMK